MQPASSASSAFALALRFNNECLKSRVEVLKRINNAKYVAEKGLKDDSREWRRCISTILRHRLEKDKKVFSDGQTFPLPYFRDMSEHQWKESGGNYHVFLNFWRSNDLATMARQGVWNTGEHSTL